MLPPVFGDTQIEKWVGKEVGVLFSWKFGEKPLVLGSHPTGGLPSL